VSGIIRKLDQRRRLVIPQETLKAAGFSAGDLLCIWQDVGDDGNPCLLLTLYRPGCVLCGATGLTYVSLDDNRLVCKDCASKIASKLKEQGEEKE